MTRFALALAAGLLGLLPSQSALATVTARISLAQQRMEVHVDGQLTHTWSVSTGREGFATPAGSYTPTWLDKNHRSQKYDDAPMPYSVFFSGGYAVHGTTALGMLGRRASHGCVRLSPANARRFFELVQEHGLSDSRVIIQDAPAQRSEKPLVAEIGSKRDRSVVGKSPARLQPARVARALPPNSVYSGGASLSYAGRHATAPVLLYYIGPQGQMIPVQHSIYRSR